MSEYKRLTERNSVGLVETLCKHCMFNGDCTGYRTHCDRAVRKRLYELEDKIENGTLIELPCKVGDIVYKIFGEKVCEMKAVAIPLLISPHGAYLSVTAENRRHACLTLEYTDFGKTVFLTKAEAEKKLKELKDGGK